MAGLRIPWRREVSGPASPRPLAASTQLTFDAFAVFAACLIVALALAARVYNVNWDENTHQHPDERHLTSVTNDVHLPGSLTEYFDSKDSRLNPYNRRGGGSFVYGTFPLILTKTASVALGENSFNEIVIVGRYLSALFDAGSVLLAFLIGRRLYGPAAGLLGAVLFATAPLAIQHAHFYVSDPFLAFFTTAVLYFSVRIVQEGGWEDYALAGLALGLGMACKVTAVLILPVIVVAVAVRAGPMVRAALPELRLSSADMRALRRPVLGLLLAGAISFLAFRVAQPYAFETPSLHNLGLALDKRWTHDQREQSRLLGGEAGFPPSVQWIGRASYVYPLKEMVRWGMAPAFGVAGWLAFGYATYRLARRGDPRHLLPLVFVLVYFGFMGRQFSLYLRYFLPLYPVLAVLAGYGLIELVRWAGAAARRLGRPSVLAAGYGVIGLVLALSLVAALAYLNIYRQPNSRVQASRDLYGILPDGAFVAFEHWDDAIPMQLPGVPDKQFRMFDLTLYDLDTRDKVAKLVDDLEKADFISISSTRLTDSIPRNPVNYPVTSRYYGLLFSGELGFRLMRTYTSYPRIFGIKLVDYKAQESWSSYDHPRVLVFEKTPPFSRARAEALLGYGPFPEVFATPKQADHHGLLLSENDLETQRRGGTWTSVFSEGGVARSMPTLVWLVALEAAALAVTPLVLLLFHRLPDRGYLLAKPLGLLLLAYAVWLAASLKIAHFDQTTILAALCGLAAVGVFALRRSGEEVLGFIRKEWRLIVFCEVLFLAAFLFFLELRLINPDLWHAFRGGEKPMDLAYLTAVTRSTTLPPYDPWFAGGYINYYYFGQFITATLLKLTTIPPEIGFNLAVPTYFALTVGGAFSTAYNLAAAGRRYLRRTPGFKPVPPWSVYAAGLLGAFFVAVAGNLDGVDQLAERLSKVSDLHLSTPVPLLDAVVNSAGGFVNVLFNGADLEKFDFWRSSRMLSPTISITEFPYFSFLFADLHAHMMAIAFEVLALGLCLNLALGRLGGRHDWQEWATVITIGLVVGSLRWINSWDYPPFVLVGAAAVLIGERRLEGGLKTTSLRAGSKLALLVVTSLLFFKPLLDSYQAPYSGLDPAPERTPLHQYLAHFGVFAAVIGTWMAFLLVRALRPSAHPTTSASSPKSRARLMTAASMAVPALIADIGLVLIGHTFVAVLLSVLIAAAYLALNDFLSRRPDAGLRLFVLALVGLGLCLSAGVDLVTLKGDIVRMNTVFKFYLHVWIFFALAASFAAWQLVFVVWWPALARTRTVKPLLRLTVAGGVTALALLVIAAVVYPVFATPARLDDRFAKLPKTLDGTAYMGRAVYSDGKRTHDLATDLQGIRWMRENVRGTPAIVEGRTDLYKWGSRFSIYTGLPTVLGWDWHQMQQRGALGFMVDKRAREVDEFYKTPSTESARRFLKRYDVQYVILGELERNYYPPEGLAKIEAGLDGALEQVFATGKLRIYRVRSEGLVRASAP